VSSIPRATRQRNTSLRPARSDNTPIRVGRFACSGHEGGDQSSRSQDRRAQSRPQARLREPSFGTAVGGRRTRITLRRVVHSVRLTARPDGDHPRSLQGHIAAALSRVPGSPRPMHSACTDSRSTDEPSVVSATYRRLHRRRLDVSCSAECRSGPGARGRGEDGSPQLHCRILPLQSADRCQPKRR
jgi:hypothetical protein